MASSPQAAATPALRKPSGMWSAIGISIMRVSPSVAGAGGLLARAVRAEPENREVAEASLVAEALLDERPHRLHLLGRDGGDRAARVADQVLTIARARRRVEPGPVAEVEVPHQADVL